MLHFQPIIGQDIFLPKLDESAEWRNTGPGLPQCLACKGIDDDVHSLTVGHAINSLCEAKIAGIEDVVVFDTTVLHQVTLLC